MRQRKREPSFWTFERRTELARLYTAGVRDAALASTLGTSVNAIRVQRHHDGLVCRKITRKSIKSYTDQALLDELARRGLIVQWRPRKLDPARAGGYFEL